MHEWNEGSSLFRVLIDESPAALSYFQEVRKDFCTKQPCSFFPGDAKTRWSPYGRFGFARSRNCIVTLHRSRRRTFKKTFPRRGSSFSLVTCQSSRRALISSAKCFEVSAGAAMNSRATANVAVLSFVDGDCSEPTQRANRTKELRSRALEAKKEDTRKVLCLQTV